MKELKVGDRVRVYSGTGFSDGTVKNLEGGNKHIPGAQDIAVTLDNEATVYVHPKQCRKLKPKEKRVIYGVNAPRLELYTWQRGDGKWECSMDKPEGCALFYRVVGCSDGEVPVSREALAEAWDANAFLGKSEYINTAEQSLGFSTLCDALGLKEWKE